MHNKIFCSDVAKSKEFFIEFISQAIIVFEHLHKLLIYSLPVPDLDVYTQEGLRECKPLPRPSLSHGSKCVTLGGVLNSVAKAASYPSKLIFKNAALVAIIR